MTESAHGQATSAITWPGLILGGVTCNGTGRRLPLSESGPELITGPGVLFLYSARSADSVSLPTDASLAVAGLHDSSSYLEIWGMAGCLWGSLLTARTP